MSGVWWTIPFLKENSGELNLFCRINDFGFFVLNQKQQHEPLLLNFIHRIFKIPFRLKFRQKNNGWHPA